MSVFLVKAIKPRKLKVPEVQQELYGELGDEGKDDIQILSQTTENWRGIRPGFEALVDVSGEDVSLLVGPTGSPKAVQKWERLDKGTKGPYPIRARRKPLLKFRTQYWPSTTPGSFKSRGAVSYGPWVSLKVVMHPGIEARGWSEMLQKQRRRPFTRRMMKALRRGMEKAAQ